jgi:hypothetical protein
MMPTKPKIGERRGTRPLGELVAGVLAPVADRRGYALANLRAAWAEVVGQRYADCTEPERIDWPRGGEKGTGGVLRVRADGPRAVLLQHELGQLVERVNGFIGYSAVRGIRLVQGPVARRARKPGEPATVDEARLAGAVATVADEPLKAALSRLGRGVFAKRP